jgi:hypothetical protein
VSRRPSSQDYLLPHRIRLRGPWEYDAPAGRYARRFHRPSGLTAASRVWLVIDEAESGARVDLNGQVLGEVTAPTATRFEVTPHLKPQNLISIVVSGPGEFMGQVFLEIEEPAS